MQIDMATPRAGQVELQGNAEVPIPLQRSAGPKSSYWSWRRPCRRCVQSGTRRGGQRTCTILKKLLQHHTHCHHQWTVRRDSESLQAELAAARWAWLGLTLLRAYDGEHADDEGPTPRQEAQIAC